MDGKPEKGEPSSRIDRVGVKGPAALTTTARLLFLSIADVLLINQVGDVDLDFLGLLLDLGHFLEQVDQFCHLKIMRRWYLFSRNPVVRPLIKALSNFLLSHYWRSAPCLPQDT